MPPDHYVTPLRNGHVCRGFRFVKVRGIKWTFHRDGRKYNLKRCILCGAETEVESKAYRDGG